MRSPCGFELHPLSTFLFAADLADSNVGIRQTVFVIDDDDAVRDALELLIQSVGLDVSTFPSAVTFLERYAKGHRGCLLVDIRMPGMSGLDLQEQLLTMGSTLPLIFITGHGDVQMAVRAMRRGAFDFLLKPFHDQELLDRIHHALKLDAKLYEEQTEQARIQDRLDSLTPRERQVMDLVVQGYANKVIASRLDLSQRTVELHRAKVMDKMDASSLAQLVRIAIRIEGSETQLTS